MEQEEREGVPTELAQPPDGRRLLLLLRGAVLRAAAEAAGGGDGGTGDEEGEERLRGDHGCLCSNWRRVQKCR